MPPKLTIGMAAYEDFHGVYFTLQALRTYHAEAMPDVELLVIDNKPESPHGKSLLAPLLAHAQRGTAGARYIPMPSPVGTSAPRNAVFEHATGDAVLCMDSHVLLRPGAVRRLIEYYDQHPESLDLLSGPLLYDDLGNFETHFDDVWRSEMWGVWGRAWQCPCGGLKFSVQQDPTSDLAQFRALKPGFVPVSLCGDCGQELPKNLPFAGSFQALEAAGFRPLGADDDQPFEIPGQGLGLFSCRREAWLGFNEHFRGFGGEELYIHEKFRQAGRKNLCLPWLKWGHRFGRPEGARYPLTVFNKVRNYVLGHQELGLDLAPIHAHFVATGRMPIAEWEFLLADPIRHDQDAAYRTFVEKTKIKLSPSGMPLPPETVNTPAALLEWCKKIPRDLDQHLDRLAELAAECEHVTEFSKRRESTVGLLGGKPQRLVSYNVEDDPLLASLPKLFDGLTIEAKPSSDVADIEETDLLFIDSQHTAKQLGEELSKFAPRVRRFIVMHDTALHGQTGEDGGPGLLAAIREFLEANPEWFIHYHAEKQYGLTVLGRLEKDRPPEKVHLWAPGYGPGTELKALLASLGIAEKPSCDCNAKAVQMDKWGVGGCREHLETIVGWMREGQERWGWKDKLKAATHAVLSGLAFKLDVTDPYPGLIEEAIRLAEEKEAALV